MVRQEIRILSSSRNIGLFSGGKDSLVACHYMWSNGLLSEVLYCKTGIGLKENINFVRNTCKRYNWKLHIVEPKTNETYEDFIRKFGFPKQGIHSAIMGYLKWHPMRKFARENPCIFVSGRRKKESHRRSIKMKSPYEEFPKEKMIFYSPLYEWTDGEVWRYIYDNRLNVCPIYQTLHLSGDCLCGSFSESGEAELIATFHPELAATIKTLEKKYGGRWGNGSSMTGATKQDKISNFICADCMI